MKESEGVPRCSCGGMIKPDVVLYEEGLDDYTIQESVRVISEAEVLIIGGNFSGGISGSRPDRLFPGKSSGGDQQGTDTEG